MSGTRRDDSDSPAARAGLSRSALRPVPHALPVSLRDIAKDPDATDIFITGNGVVWVDRGDGLQRCGLYPAPGLRDLAVALISAGGRHIDEAHPCIDVRIGEGIRVHAVLAPIAVSGVTISLRLPGVRKPRLADLVAWSMVTPACADWLVGAIRARWNILIAGATGSGKTTFLAALLAEVPASERIVTIEGVADSG